MSSVYLSKTSDLEEVFKDLGLKLVFQAQTREQLDALVQRQIVQTQEYQIELPVFRQYGVLQFIEGVWRGTAKLVGQQEGGAKFKTPSPHASTKRPLDVPRRIKKRQPGATWRKHINGGGWVSNTAYVEASAHVGYLAIVHGNARVTGRAKIYGCAVVRGDAECYGSCHVHGNAIVEGHARIFDAAKVLGKVRIGGSVTVGGSSLLRGTAVFDGEEELIDERVAPEAVRRRPTLALAGG